MTAITKAPRAAHPAKSPEQVQAMLRDIATVLRLTAKVKGEMIREQAEKDRQQLEACRASRALAAEPALA